LSLMTLQVLNLAILIFIADNTQAPRCFFGDLAHFRLISRPWGQTIAELDTQRILHADIEEAFTVGSVVLYRSDHAPSGVKIGTVVGIESNVGRDHSTSVTAAKRWQKGAEPEAEHVYPQLRLRRWSDECDCEDNFDKAERMARPRFFTKPATDMYAILNFRMPIIGGPILMAHKMRHPVIGGAIAARLMMLAMNLWRNDEQTLFELHLATRNHPAQHRIFLLVCALLFTVIGFLLHAFLEMYMPEIYITILAFSCAVDTGIFDLINEIYVFVKESLEDCALRLVGGPAYFGWPKQGHAGYHDSATSYRHAAGNGLTISKLLLAKVGQCVGLKEHAVAEVGGGYTEDAEAVDGDVADSDDDEAAPEPFRCPITHRVMQQAVVAADGHSYERQALADWLHGPNASIISPVTAGPLAYIGMVPNLQLRNAIQAWRKDPDAWVTAAREELLCNITMDTMEDPVLTCDGHCYERAAIVQWLRRHSISPRSNTQLATRALVTNRNLAALSLLLKLNDDADSPDVHTTPTET